MIETISLTLSVVAVVLALVAVIILIAIGGRIEQSVTATVVKQTTNALNAWSNSFSQTVEQVINMTVDEKLAAAQPVAKAKK